jgi:tape measure domain-containing protein
MTFDNKLFMTKVGETIGGLDKLKEALKFDKAKSGFDDISASAGRVNFGPMHTALDSINTKFLALSTVAITALSNITSKAIDTGLSMAKHLTLDNVIDGFHEYETNINSIQTILANTASKGTNLDQVNAALQQLNEYSDKTIYNFGEMAKNIGTFTAAGVDLDTSVQSIKGIANIAAMSGSSSEQASTAMYQLSQAIATGSMKLMDWNSVVNAGMGGEAMKTALFETGKAMGTLKDVPMGQTFTQWEDAGNSFRDTLQDGWVTADVLTTTLGTFTGDMTKEMLVAKGYSSEVADQILATAQIAQDAATKVKTFTQLLGTTKEQIGTGWADSFRIIIGNFQEAQQLFSMISGAIGKVIGENNNARNEILRGWAAFGGRQAMVESLINVWVALGSVLRPIQEAFREVFPPSLAANLVKLSAFIRDFTHGMIASGETGEKIKSIFKGVFSIFKIGIAIVKGIFSVFSQLVGALFDLGSGGGGGLLSLAAGIGEFVTKIQELLTSSGAIEKFFGMIGTVLILPIKLITIIKDALGEMLGALFSSFGGFGGIFSGATSAISNFGTIFVDFISRISHWLQIATLSVFMFVAGFTDEFASIIPVVQSVASFLQGIVADIGNFFANLFGGGGGGASEAAGSIDKVADSVSNLSLSFEWLSTVADALASAWDWITDRLAIFGDQLGDNMSDIGAVFGSLGDALKSMFDGIDWDTVIEAAKVALGGGLLVVINNLIKGFSKNGILSTLTGGLSDSIKGTFDQLTGTLKAMQQQIKAEALMKIAQAMAVLVIAMIALTFVDIADLGASLAAMAVGFGELTLVMVALDKLASGGTRLFLLSAGLILLALAMGILTTSVIRLSEIYWQDLLVGLGGMVALMGMLIGVSHLLDSEAKGMIRAGLSMLVMALGVRAMAWAMGAFSDMDWPTMVQGLVGAAAALGMMAGAMKLIPDENALRKGGAMLLLSFAMSKMADAVERFGSMDLMTLGKGFASIGAGLYILVRAMDAMPKNLKELAIGLLLVSVSLEVIAHAVGKMGEMDLWELIKGLGGLAIALYAIQAAANSMTTAMVGAQAIAMMAASLLALTLVIKMLADLGVGGILVGVLAIVLVLGALAATSVLLSEAIPFMFLMGVALQELAVGFALFALAAALFAGAIFLIAYGFEKFASVSESGAKNAVNAINTLLEAIPGFVARIASGFLNSIDSILEMVPGLVKIIGKALDGLLDLLKEYVPKIVDFIIFLVEELLRGLVAIYPAIAQAGLDIIIALLEGIRDAIPQIVTIVGEIITGFLDAMSTQLTEIVESVANLFTTFMTDVAHAIGLVAATIMFGVAAAFIQGFVEGLKGSEGGPQSWFMGLIGKVLGWIGSVLTSLWSTGSDLIGGLLGGIVEKANEVISWFGNLIGNVLRWIGDTARSLWDKGVNFIGGLLGGIVNKASEVMSWFGGLISAVGSWIGNTGLALLQKGKDFIDGLWDGMVEVYSSVRDWIIKIPGAIVGFIGDLGSKLLEQGKKLIQGLWDGAKDKWEDFTGWLSGLNPANWFNDINLKKGHAEKNLVPTGKALMGGLWKSSEEVWNEYAGWLSTLNPADHIDTKSLSNAIADMASSLSDTAEFNPTITPVLDLSLVQRDAKALGGMIGLAPTTSLGHANIISHTDERNTVESAPTTPTVVNFEQNNYSPNALSTNDIYRLTRSQIVLAKEELRIP